MIFDADKSHVDYQRKLQCKFSMSGEEITEHLRAEDTTFPDELVAAGVEVGTRSLHSSECYVRSVEFKLLT